jgi:acetyl-CoA acetyltransferase
MHAANRMVAEDKDQALVTACAAGAHGVAIVMQRHPLAKAN